MPAKPVHRLKKCCRVWNASVAVVDSSSAGGIENCSATPQLLPPTDSVFLFLSVYSHAARMDRLFA